MFIFDTKFFTFLNSSSRISRLTFIISCRIHATAPIFDNAMDGQVGKSLEHRRANSADHANSISRVHDIHATFLKQM